jgi:IrrE N-terminal-like domain
MATSRDRWDELVQRCADLGVDLQWRDLGETRRGEFRRPTNTIVLNSRLTRRQAVACLAHELGHQHFGDACSTPAVERRAWEYAAALVISPDEYAAAEERVGPDPAALSLELAVTPPLIHGWRRWWRARGRSVVTLAGGR